MQTPSGATQPLETQQNQIGQGAVSSIITKESATGSTGSRIGGPASKGTSLSLSYPNGARRASDATAMPNYHSRNPGSFQHYDQMSSMIPSVKESHPVQIPLRDPTEVAYQFSASMPLPRPAGGGGGGGAGVIAAGGTRERTVTPIPTVQAQGSHVFSNSHAHSAYQTIPHHHAASHSIPHEIAKQFNHQEEALQSTNHELMNNNRSLNHSFTDRSPYWSGEKSDSQQAFKSHPASTNNFRMLRIQPPSEALPEPPRTQPLPVNVQSLSNRPSGPLPSLPTVLAVNTNPSLRQNLAVNETASNSVLQRLPNNTTAVRSSDALFSYTPVSSLSSSTSYSSSTWDDFQLKVRSAIWFHTPTANLVTNSQTSHIAYKSGPPPKAITFKEENESFPFDHTFGKDNSVGVTLDSVLPSLLNEFSNSACNASLVVFQPALAALTQRISEKAATVEKVDNDSERHLKLNYTYHRPVDQETGQYVEDEGLVMETVAALLSSLSYKASEKIFDHVSTLEGSRVSLSACITREDGQAVDALAIDVDDATSFIRSQKNSDAQGRFDFEEDGALSTARKSPFIKRHCTSKGDVIEVLDECMDALEGMITPFHMDPSEADLEEGSMPCTVVINFYVTSVIGRRKITRSFSLLHPLFSPEKDQSRFVLDWLPFVSPPASLTYLVALPCKNQYDVKQNAEDNYTISLDTGLPQSLIVESLIPLLNTMQLLKDLGGRPKTTFDSFHASTGAPTSLIDSFTSDTRSFDVPPSMYMSHRTNLPNFAIPLTSALAAPLPEPAPTPSPRSGHRRVGSRAFQSFFPAFQEEQYQDNGHNDPTACSATEHGKDGGKNNHDPSVSHSNNIDNPILAQASNDNTSENSNPKASIKPYYEPPQMSQQTQQYVEVPPRNESRDHIEEKSEPIVEQIDSSQTTPPSADRMLTKSESNQAEHQKIAPHQVQSVNGLKYESFDEGIETEGCSASSHSTVPNVAATMQPNKGASAQIPKRVWDYINGFFRAETERAKAQFRAQSAKSPENSKLSE